MAIKPLSDRPEKAHDQGMRDTDVFQRSSRIEGTRHTVVYRDPDRGGCLIVGPRRLRDRLRARLFSQSLDRGLASGQAPESTRLLAARASYLTSLPIRQALARDWDLLLADAYRPRGGHPARVPFRRGQVRRAEPEVRGLVGSLLAPAPVAVRGVAVAQQLLTDSAGPVFNRHASAELADRLRAAIAWLDPTIALFPPDPGPRI